MSNLTTNILRQAGDYFIANTEDGRIRVGILDTVAIDIPYHHAEALEVAGIEDDTAFESAAEDLFDDLISKAA